MLDILGHSRKNTIIFVLLLQPFSFFFCFLASSFLLSFSFLSVCSSYLLRVLLWSVFFAKGMSSSVQCYVCCAHLWQQKHGNIYFGYLLTRCSKRTLLHDEMEGLETCCRRCCCCYLSLALYLSLQLKKSILCSVCCLRSFSASSSSCTCSSPNHSYCCSSLYLYTRVDRSNGKKIRCHCIETIRCAAEILCNCIILPTSITLFLCAQ